MFYILLMWNIFSLLKQATFSPKPKTIFTELEICPMIYDAFLLNLKFLLELEFFSSELGTKFHSIKNSSDSLKMLLEKKVIQI